MSTSIDKLKGLTKRSKWNWSYWIGLWNQRKIEKEQLKKALEEKKRFKLIELIECNTIIVNDNGEETGTKYFHFYYCKENGYKERIIEFRTTEPEHLENTYSKKHRIYLKYLIRWEEHDIDNHYLHNLNENLKKHVDNK